jgi:hypothetical protein
MLQLGVHEGNLGVWDTVANKFPSSHVATLLGFSDPEDESAMNVQNVRNYLPNDTAQHLRRLECSTTPL